MPAPLPALPHFARAVLVEALTDRYATLWNLCARMPDASPQAISQACRELVRAGWAERSVMGTRRSRVVQVEMEEVWG